DVLAALCDRRPRALLLIHFIGWPQPVSIVERMCRDRGILLIEDCALSLLSEAGGRPLGSFGDWSVFCLSKTLPVPNGAVLVRNRDTGPSLEGLELRPCDALSLAARCSELMLERMRGRVDLAGWVLR